MKNLLLLIFWKINTEQVFNFFKISKLKKLNY